MGRSTQADAPHAFDDSRLAVAVTGAAGRIGSAFAAHACQRFDLTLTDRPGADLAPLREFGRVMPCELADLPTLTEMFRGADVVLHLGAASSPAARWEQVLPDNIVGTHNAFAASLAAGCRRVVYASSVHAVSGYPLDRQVDEDEPVNPGNLYGVSKCFGEALGRYFATQRGLSVIAVRIGAFQTPQAAQAPGSEWMAGTFAAVPDLLDLLTRAIRVQGVRFAICHGVSDNWFKRLDLTATKELLGYEPAYDYMRLSARFRDRFDSLPHGHHPSVREPDA